MQEILPLRFRRFLLRNSRTGAATAIVEAESIDEADRRGKALQTIGGLFNGGDGLSAERADLPMQLPTFLESYFTLLATLTEGHS